MFIKVDSKIYNVDCIETIECYLSDENPYVYFTTREGNTVYVYGQQAMDLIMATCPSVLEGPRLKFRKHAWAIHNLVSHPLLQIFSWIGKSKVGFAIHEATVPRPGVDGPLFLLKRLFGRK